MQEPSIKKNFIYKSALTISSYLMSFIVFPYVSRILGVANIGIIGFVDNTINYFLLFATMGVGLIGVREIAVVKDSPNKQNVVFSNILGMNLWLTAIVLIVYMLCVNFIPNFQQYEKLFYIGIIKIICTAFLIEWYYTGVENFRYITVRSLLIKLIYIVAVFVLIRDQNDFELYFVLSVLVVVLNALINVIYLCRFIKIQIKELGSMKYLKQNLYIGFCSIMSSMYITFNVVYLGIVSTNVEVGYYTTAFKLYSIVLGFISAFTNVMMPRMSSLLATGKKEQFQQMANKSFEIIAAISIPLIIYCIILAPQIIYVLSGLGYEGAILPMRIIMLAVIFVGVAQVLAIQILMPMKKDAILLLASGIGAIVAILLNIFLTDRWESMGSAIVMLCSELAVTFTYVFYFFHEKILRIPYVYICDNLLYSIPCVIICFICSHFVENVMMSLLISLLVSSVYFSFIQIERKSTVGKILYDIFFRLLSK